MATPFVLYTDGPRLPTGLARIGRDLAARIWDLREAWDLDFLQVGYDPLPGPAPAWPVWAAADIGMDQDWGADLLGQVWQHQWGKPGGILFSIWDPGRSYELLSAKGPEQRWGYFPVDGTNVNDTLGGPAAEAIRRYDRVLAYGRWGSERLATIRRPIPYLPHGLDLDTWTFKLATSEPFDRAWEILAKRHEDEVVVGCVATNQPRKDLAVYFATLAELRRRGRKVRGWLHTDRLVRAWSVQQLVEDYGLAKRVSVSLTLEDSELAACYALCGCTMAPGLGEGFGYPIVESLACGTPCVHGDVAGGAELVPLNAWRVPAVAERFEGIYATRRPVFTPVDWANAVERALDWKQQDERVCQEYCRGSVEHLRWAHIWPRWEKWLTQGLEAYRD